MFPGTLLTRKKSFGFSSIRSSPDPCVVCSMRLVRSARQAQCYCVTGLLPFPPSLPSAITPARVVRQFYPIPQNRSTCCLKPICASSLTPPMRRSIPVRPSEAPIALQPLRRRQTTRTRPLLCHTRTLLQSRI